MISEHTRHGGTEKRIKERIKALDTPFAFISARPALVISAPMV